MAGWITDTEGLGAAADAETSRSLQGWQVADDEASRAVVLSTSQAAAQHGRACLALHGAISQSFPTAPGAHYAIVVHPARLVEPSPSGDGPQPPPPQNQEGLVTAPGLRRVFQLREPTAAAHDGSDDDQDRGSPGTAVAWQEHRFYFTAGEVTSNLTVSSLGPLGGLLLDNVQVGQATSQFALGSVFQKKTVGLGSVNTLRPLDPTASAVTPIPQMTADS